MKLHLPKQLFSALLSAITLAAAPLALTLGSNAWGEEESGSEQVPAFVCDYSVFDGYAYTIYQWTGTDGIISKGFWYEMEYSARALTFLYDGTGNKISSGSSGGTGTSGQADYYQNYIVSDKTLVFDAASTKNNVVQSNYEAGKAYVYDCGPMKLSGIVVKNETGVADTLVGNNNGDNKRELVIGGLEQNQETDVYETAYSIIEKDFTIDTNNSDVTLQGVQVWQVASDAKYTFRTSNSTSRVITLNGNLTLQGGTIDFQNMLKMTDDSVLSVEKGATLKATEIKSDGAASTERSISVEKGASITTNTLWIAYNMGAVDVDGQLTVNNELKLATNNKDNDVSLLTGNGTISTITLKVENHGSYGIDVNTLTVGEGGIAVSAESTLNLAAATTTVAGAVSVEGASGSSKVSTLNFNSGNVTLAGTVTNNGAIGVNGGVVTMNGGMSGTGTLNISEGAELVIAAGTTLELLHTITGTGTLTIGAADGSTTTNLGLNATIKSEGTLNLYTNLQASSESIFDMEQVLNQNGSTYDGFGGSSDLRAQYTVAQGGVITLRNGAVIYLGANDTTGTSLQLSESKDAVYFESMSGLANNVYYVTSTTATTSGITVGEGQNLDHFHVTSKGKLTVDGGAPSGKDVASILTTTTGTGTLVLNTKVSYKDGVKSTFQGTLSIADGIKLELGDQQDDQVNFSSFSSIVLGDKSTLQYTANGNSTFNNLTVNTGKTAYFHLGDSKVENYIQLAGKTTIDGTLNLTTLYDGSVAIEQLSGSGTLSTKGSSNTQWGGQNFNLLINSLSGFTGSLVFDKTNNGPVHVTINTGTSTVGPVGRIDAEDTSSFVLNVQENTTIGTLKTGNIGEVNVDAGKTLTLSGGTADSQKSHSIGTLNAASGSVTIGEYSTLTLGGGTEQAPVTHSIGTLNAAGAGISLGDYATLTLTSQLPTCSVGNAANKQKDSSLNLSIAGGQGSCLNLNLKDATTWGDNNTVSLSALTEEGKTVDTVYIASGALANTVFGEPNVDDYGTYATTNLGGAALSMANGTKLVLRKLHDSENFGAGDITLLGLTTLVVYGSVTEKNTAITNNIIGETLEFNDQGSVAFTGKTLNLQQLSGLNGKTVIFGNGDADDVKTTATFAKVSAGNGGTATLQLNSDATLNRIATTVGTITLTGSGVYDLGNSTSANVNGLGDSSKWTGTVKLSNINAAPQNGFDFDSYGNAQSQVQLSGVKGWIGMSHVDTDTNLHLVNGEGERNYGLNLHATSPKTYQFDGAISGSGDLWVGNEGGDNHLSRTFTFNGDLSAWSGKLVFGADETATVNLNGHAKDGDSGSGITIFSSVNGGLKTSANQTAELNVNIGTSGYTTTMNGGIVHEGSGNLNLTVKGNTNFKGAVTITNLTTTNNATVEFHADTIVAGNVTAGGTIHVEDGTLTVGDTLNASDKTVELSGASTGVGQGTEGKTAAKIRLEGTGNTVGTLDFGKNGYARGVLELGESSSTTAGALYMNNGVSISLEKNAKLTIGSLVSGYTITGLGADSQIGIDKYGDSKTEGYKGQFTGDNKVKYILSNVDVNVNKASADNTLAYELDNSSLTNAGSGTLTVSNEGNTITSLAANGGNVKLSASMSVNSISAKKEKVVTVDSGKTIGMAGGKVQLSTREGVNATLTAKSDNALLQLQADTSFSISDMTLSGVKISSTAGTEVVLSGVDTKGGVELAAGQFTMANKATVSETGYTDLLSGITLNNTGDSAASLTVDLGNLYSLGKQGDDGKYSLTITLDGFTMDTTVAYEAGKGLIFAEGSWLAQMLDKEANEGAVVSIQSLNEAAAATQEAAVASTNAVTYNSTPGSNVGTVISISGLSVIPEPATTTLGLVALAALVTRRRRK